MKPCPAPRCKNDVPDNYIEEQVCTSCLFNGVPEERRKHPRIERASSYAAIPEQILSIAESV